MAGDAQINANRSNAQKSTGPRTKVGKAVVARNAIKHGLFAHQDVIAEEDPQQYEEHRRRFLAELSPAGEKQGLLAGRIVSLAWRLKRAERLQNELFDYLLAREVERSMDAFLDDMNAKDLKRMHESVETDPAYAVGRMIARDYRGAKTLDRMTLHERRLEGSLYRTMRELDRVQSGRETYSAKQSQSEDAGGSVKAEGLGDGGWANHRQAALDDATQAGATESAKQSQSPDDVPAQPVETQDFASPHSLDANDPGSAKQSQLETSGRGCGFAETQDLASLQAGDATCTATDDSAKQSQLEASGRGCGFAETQDIASLQAGDATCGSASKCAKQSQSGAPAARTMFRPRARFGYHYHSH
jgi:hypothetical protein